jgi:hypothetical protein
MDVGGTKQTPGSTARLIIQHVRHHAGDDAVAAMLDRAGVADRIEELVDEHRFIGYEDKIALLEAAAFVTADPMTALRIGESVLASPVASLAPVIRALGSPGAALKAVVAAGPAISSHAELGLAELDERSAVFEYRLREPHEPSIHDCLFTIGLLSQIGPVFDLPPLSITHPRCRVEGADACVYRLSWSAPRPRRHTRRGRRDAVRGLTARFWEIERDLPLVDGGDPVTTLQEIAERAAEAVGASSHILVLTDRDRAPIGDGRAVYVGGTAKLVDDVLHGLVGERNGRRLVVPIASEQKRRGHLVLLFDDDAEHHPEVVTIVEAYARRVAIALDAAELVRTARMREETASVLLRLSRSLSEVSSVDDIARKLAAAVPARADSRSVWRNS